MVIILIYLLAQHRVKHSVVDTRNDADAAADVATAAAVADVVADEWLLTYAVEALSYVVYLVLTSAPVSGWVVAVVAAVVRVSGVSVESAVVSSSVVAGDICPQPPWTYFSHIPWSSPDIRYGCFYALKQFHIWPKIKRQRLYKIFFTTVFQFQCKPLSFPLLALLSYISWAIVKERAKLMTFSKIWDDMSFKGF